MIYKKLITTIIFLLLPITFSFSQEDVITLVPFNGDSSTYINWQIIADTTATGGLLPNRVYELTRGEYYSANRIFTVLNGETLRIRGAAGEGPKPIIFLDASGTGAQPTRPPGNFVVLNGANLELSDFCITGFDELNPDALGGVQGGLINTTAVGNTIIVDNVIFSNINGQHIRVGNNSVKVKVTNTIFANMGALTTSNLGAGKGLDLRESAIDSFIIENCTFVNFQDRAIRHYNFNNPQAGTGNFNYCRINHNTFVNGMAFHGLLSLGNLGEEAIITNNLFVDAFALGEDSSDVTRTAEWANTGEIYPNGNNRMSWIFSAPNDTTQWTIHNNYYALSAEGQAWLDAVHFTHGPFPVGSQLSWHINGRLGADSVNAFTKEEGLTLNETPNLMTNMMTWYEDPDGGNRTKNTPGAVFDPLTDDYDRRLIEYYRDTLDAAYPTAAAAYTGGVDCLPVGDLNWFPDKKAEWEAGTGQCFTPLIVVDGNKDDFYNTLTGPDDGYLQITSCAWNNNGRPTNDADLSTKVWTAWDEEWFYMYQEVMDDTISDGTTTNVWEVDNLELKFDPIPTPSDTVTNTIWDTRLTAPDMDPGDSLTTNIPDVNNKQFSRHLVAGGYVAELAIRWSAIGTSEKITPAVDNIFGLAINQHDNEGAGRVASVMWASVMDDAVWNTPKYLGTVKFLADGKLEFTAQSSVTPWRVNDLVPYDGTVCTRVGVDDDKSLLPKEFSLNQNYPNPFNPSTTIKFALPKESAVELAVFNLLGEKVVDLINQEMPAGYHQTVFDAGNFSSGVYFYRLKAGTFVQTMKLMILK